MTTLTESELADPLSSAREVALAAVNQAALAISSKLSLDATLQQIADSARTITGAHYAAIAEFHPSGRVETFISSGMTDAQVSQMEHGPVGLGLLGAIMEEREPIVLEDLASDPRSVGFPNNHPEMTSFLGLPILAGSTVLGNLYLTDKKNGEPFNDEDVEMISILANHAAVAIENAHLYEASQARARELKSRNRELEAVNAVARVMSEHLDLDMVLHHVLSQAIAVTGMDAAEVFLLDELGEELRMSAHEGTEAESFHTVQQFKRGVGFPGIVLETGQPITTIDLADEPSYLRKEIVEAGFQSYVCVPINYKNAVVGTLGLASKHLRAFSSRDLDLLEAIGHQVGIAVENSRLYTEIERLAILDERSRIGMDLHDGVIQSIYAVGLTLETTRLLLTQDPEQARQLLDSALTGLNDAIRDIRNFILDLRPHRFEGDLGQGLSRLIREFQANTMIEIAVDQPASLLIRVPAPQAQSLFLTAQEALANVARHAQASKVHLKLREFDQSIELSVEDDGRGFDPSLRSRSVGHGLANMQARAEELAGRFQLKSTIGEGTTIRVTLPLRAPTSE
jgi:signal transduction histidine kinase